MTTGERTKQLMIDGQRALVTSSGFNNLYSLGKETQEQLFGWWKTLEPAIVGRPLKIAFENTRKIIDNFAKDVPKDIGCRRGCSFCCYQFVTLTVPEAKELAPLVKKERLHRIQGQRKWGMSDFGYNEESKCVFLGDDGACEVYEKRPLACRVVHAFDPNECERRTTGKFWYHHAMESALTLYWRAAKTYPMAELLSRYVKWKK